MNRNYNPTLAYLFRRHLAGLLVADLPGGTFLEIGVGRGLFYHDLIQRNFSGICLDLNPAVIEMHRELSLVPSGLEFRADNFTSLSTQVDLLVAFEVLEHYQEDLECLRQWRERLKPGGTLLFSVPAHQRLWTLNDTRAGHARRYEKDELRQKLESEKFQIQEFWSYGSPILIWSYQVSSWFKKPLSQVQLSRNSHPEGRTHQPGAEQPSPFPPTVNQPLRPLFFDETSSSGTQSFSLLSRWFFRPWIWQLFLQLQKRNLSGDKGIGYIVKCRKQE